MIFDSTLTSRIITRLMHRECIVLDVTLGLRPACWDEVAFVNFTKGLSELVSNDVSVPDLLVDRWVVH